MAVAAAALAGCASGGGWKAQRFALTGPEDPGTGAGPTNVVALRSVKVAPLFQGRSFVYRTGENTYERDPYAGFMASPERALAEPIRRWMRAGGAFGTVVEPGSGLTASVAAEAYVEELDGDFRKADEAAGAMTIHFIVYEIDGDGPSRVLLDKTCAARTKLERRTAAALAAAWDADLGEIVKQINAAYAKALVAGAVIKMPRGERP